MKCAVTQNARESNDHEHKRIELHETVERQRFGRGPQQIQHIEAARPRIHENVCKTTPQPTTQLSAQQRAVAVAVAVAGVSVLFCQT